MTLNRSRVANDALDHIIEGVENEFKNVADGEAMTTKITERFRDTFNCPPVQEFEFLFHKNFSDDEVIVALFNPQEEQMAYFPLILEASTAASPVPLSNLRSLVLSLIFLVHRKQWSFMEQFILHGGLLVMAEMISDSNLYVRGQALEIVLSVIDCEIYDWFKPIQPGDYVQSALHKQLLGLVNQSQFLKNLIANRVGSYPGGSCRALQILAFWLSWLRAVHTQDQKLHLSALVLTELKQWSCTPSNPDEPAAEEEAKLARTIYEDFGFQQYGKTVGEDESSVTSAGSSSSSDFSMSGLSALPDGVRQVTRIVEIVDADASARVPAKETPVIVVSPEQKCSDLKAAGNAFFKDNKLVEAIEQYRLALGLFASGECKASTSLQVDLFTNCATCWWKLYQQSSSDAANAENSEYLRSCAADCRSALSLVSHYPKAVYRLVTVLLEDNRPEEALPLLLQALQHHRDARSSCAKSLNNSGTSSTANTDSVDDSSATAASSVESNIDLLTNLRVRCIAALLMKNSNEVGGLSHTDLGMSVKGAQLLQSILQRNQNDAAVDWQIVRPTLNDKTEVVESNDSPNIEGSATPAIDSEVDQLLGRRTADTSKWILEDLLNKNRLAAENSAAGVSSTSGANKENKKAALGTSNSATKSDGSKKSEVKRKKVSKVDVSSKTQSAFNDFKKFTKQYDSKFGSDIVIPDSKVEDLNALLDNAGKCIDSIWSEGSQLSDVLSCILEESHVMLLLRLVHQHLNSAEGDAAWSTKMVDQLMQCDRFDVVMSLLLAGNEPLKQYLREMEPKLNGSNSSSFTRISLVYCQIFSSKEELADLITLPQTEKNKLYRYIDNMITTTTTADTTTLTNTSTLSPTKNERKGPNGQEDEDDNATRIYSITCVILQLLNKHKIVGHLLCCYFLISVLPELYTELESIITHWATLQTLLGDYSTHWDYWRDSLGVQRVQERRQSHFECQN